MRMTRLRNRLGILFTCLLLTACSAADLYSNLNERQANEMIAALQTAGIEASKVSKDSANWTIRVSRGDFARAVDTLRAEGLPRDEFESLGRVFKKEGFVSSPLEERARLIYGLSQELSNTISAIDGVVVARVHLAVPDRDPLSDKPRSASASVMVKHRPGIDLSGQIGQIKALVVNSVEGLTYDSVTVSLFPAREAMQGARARADAAAASSGVSLSALLPYGGAAVLLLLLMAGFWMLRERRWRMRSEEE
jgi:type III secretion protein J